MDNIHSLYHTSLEKIKSSGQNQYLALCPFHEDTKQSFSFNSIGLAKCFACGWKGNAYQYAKDRGFDNPKQYIVNGDNSFMDRTSKPKFHKPTASDDFTEFVETLPEPEPKPEPVDVKKMEEFKSNLRAKYYKGDLKYMWGMDDIIDAVDVGWNDKEFVFGYHNKDGELISYRYHRLYPFGDKKCKWYLQHKIGSYDKEKDLFICEGEKDALVLYFRGFQVTTSSNGCSSIPRNKDKSFNVEVFEGWKGTIYLTYDAIDGVKGSKELAKAIKDKYPNIKVEIVQWADNLKKGYDVWDAFNDDVKGTEWMNAVMNSVEYVEEIAEPVEPKDYKGFEVVLNGEELLKQDYEPTEPVIKSILYKNQIAIVGGGDGVGKSWVAIQSALSIASGTLLFDYFETKPMKTLLVQFENENYDIMERVRSMSESFFKKTGSRDWFRERFHYVPMSRDSEVFIDNWKKIEATILDRGFRDGVLIVDNLYTSTEVNLQDNNELKVLVNNIQKLSRKYNLTILLICHINKGLHEIKDLNSDLFQGGKTLTNYIANVTMMGKSAINIDWKVMKIVKGGRSEKNLLEDTPFKLIWSDDTCTFRKGIAINNIAKHFTGGKARWEYELVKEMISNPEISDSPTITKAILVKYLPKEYENAHPEKVRRLINKLIAGGYLERPYGQHNTYRFLIDDILEEESFTPKS